MCWDASPREEEIMLKQTTGTEPNIFTSVTLKQYQLKIAIITGKHLLPLLLQVAITAENVLICGCRVTVLSSVTVAVLNRSDTERGERKWETDKGASIE
jgi:hypothetical protein